MRYREGQEIPDNIDPHIGDAAMAFTAIMGLFIGIILSWLAKKGKQIWLLFWGIGLILVSFIYLVFIALST